MITIGELQIKIFNKTSKETEMIWKMLSLYKASQIGYKIYPVVKPLYIDTENTM